MGRNETKEQRSRYWKHYRLNKAPYTQKVCEVCGDPYVQTSNAQKRCNACRMVTCNFCGEKFIPNNSTLKHSFCSRSCKRKSQQGSEPEHLKNNRGRKPRTYHLTRRDKHGNAFDREWRTAVFERDNYTCRSCGKKGGRLEAHHIKAYKTYPELRHVLANGLTLCKKCHTETDTYGWANYWKNEIAVKRLGQGVLPL